MSLKWIPNALTLARCVLAFWVGWLILNDQATYWPLIAFVVVALTDFVDGFAARALKAVSAFGAFMDPIADKLLVAIALLALSYLSGWAWWLVLPTGIIIARDTMITLLRLNPDLKLPVSQLAKYKTALEMIGISGLLVPALSLVNWGGLAFVWLAAALSAYTGLLYAKAALAQQKTAAPKG